MHRSVGVTEVVFLTSEEGVHISAPVEGVDVGGIYSLPVAVIGPLHFVALRIEGRVLRSNLQGHNQTALAEAVGIVSAGLEVDAELVEVTFLADEIFPQLDRYVILADGQEAAHGKHRILGIAAILE